MIYKILKLPALGSDIDEKNTNHFDKYFTFDIYKTPKKIYPIKNYNHYKKKAKEEVPCTLSDLYFDCYKTCYFRGKKFIIEIKKGFNEGTKFTFPDEICGNNFYDLYDVTFEITLVKDQVFVKKGSNLECTTDSKSFIPGKKYKLSFEHPNKTIFTHLFEMPKYKPEKLTISGMGMFNRKTGEYGDLIVKFE